MSLFSRLFGAGIVWTRNESWVVSCGRRTLEGFTPQTDIPCDFAYLRKLRPTKKPRKVRLRLDVAFHFVDCKIVIDDVHMASQSPNCEVSGSDIDIDDSCIDRKAIKRVLQQEADTKKCWIRSSIIRMLHEEQEAAGGKYVTADA